MAPEPPRTDTRRARACEGAFVQQLRRDGARLVLGLTIGGSSLLYMLIQRGAAASVTSLMYLVPPCTAIIAWFLFSEPITVVTIAGTAFTALGVSLVVRVPKT